MLKEIVSTKLLPFIDLSSEELLSRLEVPANPELGDVAFPCFILAKTMKKPPHVIAEELSKRVNDANHGGILRAEAVSGYVNVFVNRSVVGAQAVQEALQPSYGASKSGGGRRVVIDFSSPNIAKPFGIGHLRSTMIGNALYQLYMFTGHDTVRVNHLGDWGTQFGKMIAAYIRWGDEEAVKKNPIEESLALYVRFHEEAELQPELEDEGRAWFSKLEQGDEQARALWEFFVSVSLEEFRRMYDKLGVQFDYVLGESFYNDKMKAVVDELHAKGLLSLSDGAQVVRLDEHDLPPCIILKSDGSTIYATRDLATVKYRLHDMGADKIVYVVGGEQTLHFKQLFLVLEKLGEGWKAECEHIPFGLMKFEGKKMSTRRGKIVKLEEVLTEAVNRVKTLMASRNAELGDPDGIAEAVGVGAVIFGDLKNSRMHEVNFSLDEALSFDGETGPYVQYTNVRVQSLLMKAGKNAASWLEQTDLSESGAYYTTPSSWEVIKLLMAFPAEILRAVDKNEPSVVARYLLELSKAFNRFYHTERILAEDAQETEAKLALCAAVGQVLQRGLQLLGIRAPKQM